MLELGALNDVPEGQHFQIFEFEHECEHSVWALAFELAFPVAVLEGRPLSQALVLESEHSCWL